MATYSDFLKAKRSGTWDVEGNVIDWMTACCEFGPRYSTHPREAYLSYVGWCKRRGFLAYSRLNWGKAMARAKVRVGKYAGRMQCLEIALKSPDPLTD